MEGCALAAQIGRPHRHPPRVRRRGVARPQDAIDPAEKQPAGIARSTDLALAGHGRDGPQARHLPRLGDGHPHDQRGAAQHQHVAVVDRRRTPSARTARRWRRPPARRRPPTRPTAAPGASTRGIRSTVAPRCAHSSAFQPVPSNSGRRRVGGGKVDDRLARQRVVGHRRSRPVTGRVRRLSGRPAQEFGGLAHRERAVGRQHRPTRPRPSPYSSPGVIGRPPASTAVSDGTIAETATASASGPRQLVQRRQRALPPGLVGVVLQPVRRRHPQLVRNPCPRDHPAILIGGDRFDGGGADVDADCDLFA